MARSGGRTSSSCTGRSSRRSRTTHPTSVITFDEDGLYWHVDHIGVHERTTTAVKSFGAAAPPLYYVTIPYGVMREVTDAAVANGWVPPGSTLFGITPDAFGIAARAPQPHGQRHRLGASKAGGASLPPHPDGAGQPVRSSRSRGGQALARDRALPPRADQLGRIPARPDRGAGARAGLEKTRQPPRPQRRDTEAAVHTETLDLLRCPYCGGRLALVTSLFNQVSGDEIEDGILGCHCCIFPVVSGIPILHLLPASTAARDQVQAGRPDLARRIMFGLEDEAAGRDLRSRGWRGDGHVSRPGRGARPTFRRRLLPVSLFGSDLRRRRRGGPRDCRHGARRRRSSGRHLRRLRSPDARAPRPLAAAPGARRSLFRESVAGTPVHRAGLRGDLLRRQRADAVCARRLPLRHVRRRVHVYLDEASVRRGPDAAGRWRRRGRRHDDRAHPQRAGVVPFSWTAAVARPAIAICSRRSSRASSARPGFSPTS